MNLTMRFLFCALISGMASLFGPDLHANAPLQKEMPVISVHELPVEARETLALIKKGGPFPYNRDASRFANRENKLPRQKRDYYREYTVKTPGSRNRGARRIVAGSSQEYYYTDDHYASFKRIKE